MKDFVTWLESDWHALQYEGQKRVDQFVQQFYQKFPTTAKFKVRIIYSPEPHSGGTQEAECTATDIRIYGKFFTHTQDIQTFMLTHELGHWILDHFGIFATGNKTDCNI